MRWTLVATALVFGGLCSQRPTEMVSVGGLFVVLAVVLAGVMMDLGSHP